MAIMHFQEENTDWKRNDLLKNKSDSLFINNL